MAYACPVCDALVPDGEHLAHHLAVVAMTRGGDHGEWLDEEVPGWQECEPAELADATLEHAAEVAHDLVDDPRATRRPQTRQGEDRPSAASGSDAGAGETAWNDGVGPDRPGDGAARGHAADAVADARAHAPFSGQADEGSVDADTAAILEEARELTRRRQSADSDGDDAETDVPEPDEEADGDTRAGAGRTDDSETDSHE